MVSAYACFNMKPKRTGGAVEKPRRVFLADQFSMVRLTVAEWLERTYDLTVCGQADSATNALKAIRRLKPDIVVTEIFSQQNLKFIETLHKQRPRLPILVFSFRDERCYAPQALEAGADGYLLKGVSAQGLVDGIRRTLEGRVVLSPNMRYQLLEKCVRRGRAPALMRKSHCQCHAQGRGRHQPCP
jgi:DNA-binding NarL/FixJ family response regulator